jgi:hypothetical protein
MPRRSKRRQIEVQLHIRLYPGQDDELLHWLEQFDDRPYGVKSQAVKEALLRGVEGAAAPGGAPVIDHSAALMASLSEVRRVVEAAVETALSRFQGQVVAATVPPSTEDDEADDLLDTLGENLVLRSPCIQGKD